MFKSVRFSFSSHFKIKPVMVYVAGWFLDMCQFFTAVFSGLMGKQCDSSVTMKQSLKRDTSMRLLKEESMR